LYSRNTFRPKRQKTNDDRYLDHRWRRVLYLVDRGHHPAKTREDVIIRQTCKFLRALRRPVGSRFRPFTPYQYAAIAGAYDCYLYLSPLQQAELEARLLAGQGNFTIADRCAIPAKMVRVYHDLFYDVRHRLSDTSFIARRAMNWCPRPDNADYMGALGLFGYCLGGRAVDALLYYFIAPPDAGVCADGAPAVESEKARWEKLFEQASRTSNSFAQNEGNEWLRSLVTLLREEGARLVAEGVAVPVPPPPKDPPVKLLGERAWLESTREGVDKYYLGPLLVEDEDGVIRLC
jgi:hypothetical protein